MMYYEALALARRTASSEITPLVNALLDALDFDERLNSDPYPVSRAEWDKANKDLTASAAALASFLA